jgi:hypothetical protein
MEHNDKTLSKELHFLRIIIIKKGNGTANSSNVMLSFLRIPTHDLSLDLEKLDLSFGLVNLSKPSE